MRILALDLGLRCGVAITGGEPIASEIWQLDRDDDQAHSRFGRLFVLLSCRVESVEPDLIAYEELHFAGGGPDALVSYGGLRGVLLLVAARHDTRYLGVKPATWKKAAGLGAGSKAKDALAAARARWPGVEFASADEAVARWIAVAAAERT